LDHGPLGRCEANPDAAGAIPRPFQNLTGHQNLVAISPEADVPVISKMQLLLTHDERHGMATCRAISSRSPLDHGFAERAARMGYRKAAH
jgi:hypothetical protein